MDIEYLFEYESMHFSTDYQFKVYTIEEEGEPEYCTIPTDFSELKTMFSMNDYTTPLYPENYKVTVNGSDFDITENSKIELSAGNSYYVKVTMLAEDIEE